MLGTAPVYFKSSKQKTVTRSSTEAELVGISDALSEIFWTREYLIYQGLAIGPVTLYQDNCSTIFLANKGRTTSERLYIRPSISDQIHYAGTFYYSVGHSGQCTHSLQPRFTDFYT